MSKEIDSVYEVYKEKSFSRAAKNLYMSQPALSNVVKKVEAELGTPIFDRSTIPLTVTKDGEYYINAIIQIRQIQDNIRKYFRDLDNLKTGTLSLGGSSYFCSFVFPEMISHFNSHYPDVNINLVEGNISEIRQSLEDGSIDLILETAIPSDDERIESFFYKKEHIILAVPESFSVNRKLQPYQLKHSQISSGFYLDHSCPCVPFGSFRDVPFISMKPGNDIFHRSQDICRHFGFKMNTRMFLDQVLTSVNIAFSGAGAIFIRADIVKHIPDDGRVIYYKVDDLLTVRDIRWSVKKGRYLSKAAREFMRIASFV